MKGELHIDLTCVAAEIAGYENWKDVGKNAAFPDAVRTVQVSGVGAHLFGQNLAALCHFAVPVGLKKDTATFTGYCWKRDDSVPHLDLPDRKIVALPEEWRDEGEVPIPDSVLYQEPLEALVRVLRGHGSLAADELTYPAASTMAHWIGDYAKSQKPLLPEGGYEKLCGWLCHMVEDCATPPHAWGVLLDWHSTYEGAQVDMWRKVRHGNPEKFKVWKEQADLLGVPMSPREAAEAASWNSRKRFGRFCGWSKNVEGGIRRGLRYAVSVLRHMNA